MTILPSIDGLSGSLSTNAASASVVVVGGMNMDLVAQSTQAVIAGDSNPGRIQSAPGGVARNVAENLARLGHAAELFSLVGDDALGQSLLSATRAAGVGVDGVQILAGQGSSTYLSVHTLQGELDFAINDMALLEQLTPERLQTQATRLQAAAALVVDANLSPAALGYVLGGSYAGPIFADAVSLAKCVRLKPWLAAIHTLKVNRLEAQALCGFAVHTHTAAMEAARHLKAQGVKNVVVSLGEDGACWADAQGQSGHWSAARIQVVNVSGAGDALLAGLVHGHCQGWPLQAALEFAVACAEITLGSAQANAPDLSVARVEHYQAARHTACIEH